MAVGASEGRLASAAAVIPEDARARVISLLSAYEISRAELLQRENLQHSNLMAMRHWEAGGRPSAANGVLPVFAQYGNLL